MTYLIYPDFVSIHGWGMTGHPQFKKIRQLAADGTPADYLPTDAATVAQVKRSTAPVKWDVASGAIVLFGVTAAFMIAGATVLLPRLMTGELIGTFEGWRLLTDQASIWHGIHPSLVWVYYFCILAALWGTLQSYPDVYTRGIVEYAGAIWPTLSWQRRRVHALVCFYILTTTTSVIWSNINFNTLTLVVAFLATNLGVTWAMLAGIYLDYQLPPPYRIRRWMLVTGFISAGILIVVSAVTGFSVCRQVGSLLYAPK
jgi:hypothetical protein